jgi:hypothetical protein
MILHPLYLFVEMPALIIRDSLVNLSMSSSVKEALASLNPGQKSL